MDNLKRYTIIALVCFAAIVYARWMRERTISLIYQRDAHRAEMARMKRERKQIDSLTARVIELDKRLTILENE